jgi:Cdc6-like AAA superfamily ATPase
MLPSHLDILIQEIQSALPSLQHSYYRLAIIIGKKESGKTRVLRALAESAGSPLVNVNLKLAELLLEHTIADRPRVTQQLMNEIIKEAKSPIVLLDNLELLFDVTLKVNPLQILKSLSRNTTIIASWSGTYDGRTLVYAEPGHPEYQTHTLLPEDALVFPIRDSI